MTDAKAISANLFQGPWPALEGNGAGNRETTPWMLKQVQHDEGRKKPEIQAGPPPKIAAAPSQASSNSAAILSDATGSKRDPPSGPSRSRGRSEGRRVGEGCDSTGGPLGEPLH